jgi:hypothetical protein
MDMAEIGTGCIERRRSRGGMRKDICGEVEKRRANHFKGCVDEFGAEPSAGVSPITIERDAADGGEIVGLSGLGQRPL